MRWMEDYKSKVVSAEQAVTAIKSEDKLFSSGNAATPYQILNALANRKEELHGVEVKIEQEH